MRKPNPLLAALVFLAVIATILLAGIALTVNDALWFLPVFRADAAYFDLYWNGDQLRIEPGSPGYDLLNEALHEDLPHVVAYPKGAGLSDATLQDLRANGQLLEAYYDAPARIHSWYSFGASHVFYVPLSGHHSDQNRVFNAALGVPLELRSLDAVRQAAESATP
jgi:hypothetical protein